MVLSLPAHISMAGSLAPDGFPQIPGPHVTVTVEE